MIDARTEPLDQPLAELASSRGRWLDLPLARKIEYARGLLRGTARTAAGQVEAACNAKGVSFDSHAAGEDWIGGPYVVIRTLRLLIESLEQLRRQGSIQLERSRVRTGQDGRAIAEVFPLTLYDRLLYQGFRAHVWMKSHVTPENLHEYVGGVYTAKERTPGVALVLGAGNVASIAPLDVVHKLFVEGRVVILKLNPVNEYLGPFFEDAFSNLIRDGFVRIVYGGGDVGAYLCHHPSVDEIHITGSAHTHDVIVWGPGDDGARRKAGGTPLLQKPITSELGNVSPVILVPGRWSSTDLRFQAENIATQMTQNAGFNCNAAKVLITEKSWPQRGAFLDELRRVLRSLPQRPAYYPGAHERWQRFVDAHPESEVLGPQSEASLPPALIPGLDPNETGALALNEESFCMVTAETSLEAESPATFLRAAADWSNENLYGTLNACVVLHPSSRKTVAGELENAVADLRYGAVGVNQWPAMAFALGSTTWGAYPGHTIDDIQSGIGTVHNTFLFNEPEKSVVEGPFRVFPKPAWFVTHSSAHEVGKRLVELETDPSYIRLPGIVLAALRG